MKDYSLHDFDKKPLEHLNEYLGNKWDEFELIHIDEKYYYYNCWDVRSFNGEDINYNECAVKINKYTLTEEE